MLFFKPSATIWSLALLLAGLFTGCSSEKQENYKTDDTPDQLEIKKEVTLEEPSKPAPAAIDSAALFMLTDSTAGRLRLGMPTDSIAKKFSVGKLNKTIKMQEGMAFTVHEITNRNNELSLVVEETCKPDCYISRVTVKDPRYKTKDGIGVGSTYGQARQCHQIKYVSGAEGNLTAVVEKPRVSFVLDKSQVNKNLLNNPKPDQIPDSIRIISVLVY